MDLLEHRPPRADVLEFLGLASDASFGLSIPTNTVMMLASTISRISSGSSARSIDASVKNVADSRSALPDADVAQDFLDRFLVADQIVVDDENDAHSLARIASSSARICGEVLIRGRRPNVTMMSQNSH